MRRAALLVLAVLLAPAAFAASGHFTRGNTWLDAHEHRLLLEKGQRLDATLTWDASRGQLQLYGAVYCPSSVDTVTCYATYATMEADGCDGWGSAPLASSPARVSLQAPFRAVHALHVRAHAATTIIPYQLDVTVDGAPRSVSQAAVSVGAGWVSCHVGFEGP